MAKYIENGWNKGYGVVLNDGTSHYFYNDGEKVDATGKELKGDDGKPIMQAKTGSAPLPS